MKGHFSINRIFSLILQIIFMSLDSYWSHLKRRYFLCHYLDVETSRASLTWWRWDSVVWQICDLKPGYFLPLRPYSLPSCVIALLLVLQKLTFISLQLGFAEEIRSIRLIFYLFNQMLLNTLVPGPRGLVAINLNDLSL